MVFWGPPSPILYSPLKIRDTADNDTLFIAVNNWPGPIMFPGVPFSAGLSGLSKRAGPNCPARVGGVSHIKRFPVHSTSIYQIKSGR